MMKCPKCQGETEAVSLGGIEVDRCTECKGIWFDSTEHEALKKIEGSELIDNGDVSVGKVFDGKHDIVCPRCMVFMQTVVDTDNNSITYEKCPSCEGIFLDAGEFKESKREPLIEFLKSFHG